MVRELNGVPGVNIIPSSPNWSGGLCAWWSIVNFFHLLGLLVSAKLKDMTEVLSIALTEALKALDFVSWLNYYYFVLFYCLPLLWHFFLVL